MNPRRTTGLLGSLIAIAALACGSSPDDASLDAVSDSHGRGGADGGAFAPTTTSAASAKSCTTDAQCGQGRCNATTHACACGGQSAAATKIAPDVLIVLDRSCSMTDSVGGNQTKWSAAVAALGALTTRYANDVRFGLTLFPDRDGEACSQGTIPIPVADGTAPLIQSLLTRSLSPGDAMFPSGPCSTNIDTGLAQAEAQFGRSNRARPGYVVLVTDGVQSLDCSTGGAGDPASKRAVQSLAAEGVGTFVVGFGSDVSPAFLDDLARAGGHARTGAAHSYFDAVDQASLEAALQAIGRATLSCDFVLQAPPPNDDAGEIYVFFDDKGPAVPRDPSHANGWDYDAAAHTVRFYGATCDSLRTGSVQSQSIVFGCPGSGAIPSPRLR